MKSIFATACLALLCTASVPIPQDRPAKRPFDVFAELDGTWRGQFVGYDTAGVELYRIRVQQTYKTVDAHTQRVEIRDTMADGKVITGKGTNRAIRAKDGSITLTCRVTKSTGETVRHRGRSVRGPTGRREIVWYSKTKDRTETFREWVTHSGEKPGGKRTYHIQGLGVYDGKPMLMAGAYDRVEPPPKRRK